MINLVINSATSLGIAIKAVRDAYIKYKQITIKIYAGERTLDQNAFCYVLYKQVSDQKGDMSELEVRRHCKYFYGLPILRRHSGYAVFLKRLSTLGMEHEEKLKSMDYLDVTSIMSVEELREYIDTMIMEWAKQGIILESNRKQAKQ